MRKATVLIREHPHYRRDAFCEGLSRAGFAVDDRPCGHASEHDVLVIWNRYGSYDAQARFFERAGAAVVVAENGYLPMKGTKKTFALALGHHNGAGRYAETEDRSGLLDASLKPWRRIGHEIVLLPQRGIGEPGVAMPKRWTGDVETYLSRRRLHYRIRRHPGIRTDVKPLEDDLANAKAALIWASGAGIRALCEGVPVFYDFPQWIGRAGGCADSCRIIDGDPVAAMGDRDVMLEDVARAQWSVEEVTTGEPFARLMNVHCGGIACV